jgi:uncharacterized membrane protein YjjP (DUF1212 family)
MTYPPHPHHHHLGLHNHDHDHNHAHSDEDYDYRLDQDPVVSDEDYDGNDLHHTEEKLLDAGANDHVTTYVPLGETDGLPSLPTQETSKDAAADLVRAHSSRWGILRRRVNSGSVKRQARAGEGTDTAAGHGHSHNETRTDVDGEKRTSDEALNPAPPPPRLNPSLNPPPGSGMPPIPGGTSVLGTLLTLYHQQQLDSAGTTPASSRPASIVSSFDSLDGHEHEHHPSWSEKHLPWKRRHASHASRTSEDYTSPPGHEHRRTTSNTSIADRPTTPRDAGLLGSFARAVDNFRDDRPKAARSSAGVFGALIQNTGAVAAVAAPTASTLIPSASKPGYRLQRFNLGEESPAPSLPVSRAGSRPGSIHSSTAEHTAHASPVRPETTNATPTGLKAPEHDLGGGSGSPPSKSSDNLLMMKKPRRPHSLNLNLNLKSAEKFMRPLVMTPEREGTTPGGGGGGGGGDYFSREKHMTEDDRRRKEWEAEKRRRKRAKEQRKKQEVFIIQHVAAILARQHFIMKLARALMMFGSPSHRLETQIQATAKVLEINAQVVYLPGTMLLSFSDDATHTSETKFLKQATGLDLGKLLAVHNIYWDVVHDKVSVDEANKDLDHLMTSKPHYNAWQTLLIGGLCSSFIVVPSFYGSFLDALMCYPLGVLLVAIQLLAAKNDMFSNVFEITIATLISFLAAVLGSTNYFCYTALVSGGVVLILPGYIVLTGALEIASRNITAGAVRIAYSVMYSLFLGFGISIGAEIYIKIRGEHVQNADDYTCSNTHYPGAPWYMRTPSGYWYYLCVPGYSLVLSLRNQQPLLTKELPIMVAIACAGWVTNHFSQLAFPNRSDIISALGSFCVGLLGNLYGRFFSNGASFPVMVVGILFQLPSGLSAGGLFT